MELPIKYDLREANGKLPDLHFGHALSLEQPNKEGVFLDTLKIDLSHAINYNNDNLAQINMLAIKLIF